MQTSTNSPHQRALPRPNAAAAGAGAAAARPIHVQAARRRALLLLRLLRTLPEVLQVSKGRRACMGWRNGGVGGLLVITGCASHAFPPSFASAVQAPAAIPLDHTVNQPLQPPSPPHSATRPALPCTCALVLRKHSHHHCAGVQAQVGAYVAAAGDARPQQQGGRVDATSRTDHHWGLRLEEGGVMKHCFQTWAAQPGCPAGRSEAAIRTGAVHALPRHLHTAQHDLSDP